MASSTFHQGEIENSISPNGAVTRAQASAASLGGYLQLALGTVALVEVIRRLLFGSGPEAAYMILVAAVALVANAICLKLVAAHRKDGAHMRASFIFSQNDVIANCAVILSGVLVALSGWAMWDLIAGVGSREPCAVRGCSHSQGSENRGVQCSLVAIASGLSVRDFRFGGRARVSLNAELM